MEQEWSYEKILDGARGGFVVRDADVPWLGPANVKDRRKVGKLEVGHV